MKIETIIYRVLFIAAALFLARVAYPSQKEKQAAGLHLNIPIETPDGVHLSWLGGDPAATYSIYRRDLTDGAGWTRIASGLRGVNGAYFHPGFTLDRNVSYRLQTEVPGE
ncbi:MAG: hypothetical protein PHS50_15780 [Kiritimatiellae bacterium]|nr:hypothetical protein [Kiritimatiellia bacterium]